MCLVLTRVRSLQTALCMPYGLYMRAVLTYVQMYQHEGRTLECDPPLEPLTSTLAMMGNLAPRACANFLTSALLPGSWPPNCNTETLRLQKILLEAMLYAFPFTKKLLLVALHAKGYKLL